MSFQLCEGLLDRIEVGRVRRKVEKLGTCCFDDLAHLFAFVRRQIVHHHGVAALQCWHEALFEIGPEDWAVHRFVDYEGRRDPIVPEASDEGGDLPMAMRHLVDQPLSAPTAASETGHVGTGAGLIDEDQAGRIKQPLIVLPALARGGYVGAILLAGVHGFF